MDLLLDLLAGTPLKLHRRRFLSNTVVIGCHCAMTIGGEEHRHQSTSSCEKFYRYVFPATAVGSELTHWDLFHRDEVAVVWAMKQVGLAMEVLDVAQVILQFFGVVAGRVLFRGTAAFMRDGCEESFSRQGNENPKTVRFAEGHASARPFAHGRRTTEALYRNFRVTHLALEARSARARGVGDVAKAGSQSVEKMVDVARRANSLDFIAFLLLSRDLNNRTFRPFAAASQDTSAQGPR